MGQNPGQHLRPQWTTRRIAVRSRLLVAAVATLLALQAPPAIEAQEPEPIAERWTEHIIGFASVADSLAVDSHGDTVVTGWLWGSVDIDPGPCRLEFDSDQGSVFMVRFDGSGNLVWARQVAESGVYEGGGYPRGVAFDPAGNVITTGTFADTGDFDPGSGTYVLTAPRNSQEPTYQQTDVFVLKLSAKGGFTWVRQLGPTTATERVWDLAIDAAGNTILGGEFAVRTDFRPGSGTAYLTPAGVNDGFVWKLAADGSLGWARRVGGVAPPLEGDPDKVSGVAFDAAGNVLATGQFSLDTDFDPGAGTLWMTTPMSTVWNGFVWKLSSVGSLIWARQFVGSYHSAGLEIVVDDAGDSYIAGAFSGSIDLDPGPGVVQHNTPDGLEFSTMVNAFVVKLDAQGDFEWGYPFSASASYLDSLTLDAGGGVLAAGWVDGTFDFDPGPEVVSLPAGADFLLRLTADGDLDWVLQTPGRITGMAVAPSGDIFGTGQRPGGPYPGGYPFVTRLDPSPSAGVVERYAGTDRYCTAADISAEDFPTAEGPIEPVFIATGSNYPDALAGAAVAGRLQSPLLLVGGSSLSTGTISELNRMTPSTIIVLGGPAAISDATETALLDHAPSVIRIAGDNRFQTAIAISQYGFPDPGSANTVFVATGFGFADALAAGPAAAALGGPVLLNATHQLDPAVAEEIVRLGPSAIVVVGGAAAISDEVLAALDALQPTDTVTRIAGHDRYTTSVALSQYAFPDGAPRAYVATGFNFPDALAGAAAAGAHGSPLLLVGGQLSSAVSAEIDRLGATTVIILGGSSAVPSTLTTALETLIG